MKPTRSGILQSPDGQIVKFNCITIFANKYNLSKFHISQLLNGQRITYKGWQLPKIWLIKDKNGEIHTIKSLYRFCRDNGLIINNLVALLFGKIKHHKGWVLPETVNRPSRNAPRVKTIVGPTGEIYKFYNISEFCRRMNIERSGINKVLNGKLESINGWKKYE